MDPREVIRLMAIIQGNGHDMRYDPRTRQELDAWGTKGYAEKLLGHIKVCAPEPGEKDSITLCIVIAPGEMLQRPDNQTCKCDWGCGRTVQHRPWVTLPKVCLYCAAERTAKDQ